MKSKSTGCCILTGDVRDWLERLTQTVEEKVQFFKAEIAAGRYEIQTDIIASLLLEQQGRVPHPSVEHHSVETLLID